LFWGAQRTAWEADVLLLISATKQQVGFLLRQARGVISSRTPNQEQAMPNVVDERIQALHEECRRARLRGRLDSVLVFQREIERLRSQR
jgi:hypothetical protein